MTLINIPLTLASTAPTSMMPEVSAQYAIGDLEETKRKIDQATWDCDADFDSGVCGTCRACTAGYTPDFSIYRGSCRTADGDWRYYGYLKQYFKYFKWCASAIGKANIPMINAAISLGVDIVFLALVLVFTNMGIYAVVLAMVVYALDYVCLK